MTRLRWLSSTAPIIAGAASRPRDARGCGNRALRLLCRELAATASCCYPPCLGSGNHVDVMLRWLQPRRCHIDVVSHGAAAGRAGPPGEIDAPDEIPGTGDRRDAGRSVARPLSLQRPPRSPARCCAAPSLTGPAAPTCTSADAG